MADKMTQKSLENVSGFSPDSCLQASEFGRMFPDGLDVEDKQSASRKAWQRVRAAGLDVTFAACSVAQALAGPEVLVEFRGICLQQLRDLLPSDPPTVLATARPNTPAYKAATRHQKLIGAPITGNVAYEASVATRLAARALGSLEQERAVYAAQTDWWELQHSRLLAGEL
jgi:hypothetical protein